MLFKRDFVQFCTQNVSLPIKVLKGPRQTGKTTLLESLCSHQVVYFDDLAVRTRALENPRLFFDQLPDKIILDEAPLAPPIFPELKRRVDERRKNKERQLDVWITSSNQTILQRNVRESLAGRASYFDFNTLSIHELAERWHLSQYLMCGGWPELYVSPELSSVRYLNDLITTFIEKDIIAAAGIEKKAAFMKTLRLVAGRIGQLFNASDIATQVGVEMTTVQSWCALLRDNGILREIQPYHSNLNKRLIKAPKYYFEDIGLASRLQGWTEAEPVLNSPVFGHSLENIALSEISRFFINRGEPAEIYFLRTKEKIEINFLVQLPNQRFVAIEVKSTPVNFTTAKLKLLDSLELHIVDRWVVSPTPAPNFADAKVVTLDQIWEQLMTLVGNHQK